MLPSYFDNTAPTSSPVDLRVSDATQSTITITWDHIPCAERNGRVTGYHWRVALTSDPTIVVIENSGCSESRSLTITDLTPSNNYTIEVQAFHVDFSTDHVRALVSPSALITARAASYPGNCYLYPCM